jgi:hypothetical protein
MKSSPQNSQKRFSLFLSENQFNQVQLLCAAGLTMSTIARQAIRKCQDLPLEPEGVKPRPKRFTPYLSTEDVSMLSAVAGRLDCSKAEALRLLVSKYLSINESAINSLF